MSLKSQHLQFLDVRSIKAYKCKIEKGFFPSDYFDSYDKLSENELPSHDLFYSKWKTKI